MPFCSAITNHCCIGIKQGYKPCCRFGDEETAFYVGDYTFSEYKKSQFFVNLEKELEQGWPKGCLRCRQEEQHGLTSLRQRYNKRMSGTPNRLEFIELSISNHCNLTCKMCENFSSSKWQAVIDANADLLEYDFFGKEKKPAEKFSFERVFEGLDLEHLNTVKYLGGEPFITPELGELVEFLTENALIGKIDFRCNTNCTFYPKKLIDKLLRFKSLRIDLSVDGVDELCNFIRTGEAWSKVSEVIEQWISLRDRDQRITLILHHTSQALNLHQFDKIKKFAEDKKIYFSYSILNHPRYLDYTVLPKDYVNELISNGQLVNKKIIEILLKTRYNNENKDKFVSYLKDTDRILKTDLKKVIPLLHDYIEFS